MPTKNVTPKKAVKKLPKPTFEQFIGKELLKNGFLEVPSNLQSTFNRLGKFPDMKIVSKETVMNDNKQGKLYVGLKLLFKDQVKKERSMKPLSAAKRRGLKKVILK